LNLRGSGEDCIMSSFITCAGQIIITVITSSRLRWAGRIARVRDMRNSYKILVGNLEGNRQPGRAKSRWEDVVTINLREIGCKGVDWMHMARNRDQWRCLVNTVMNFRVPFKGGEFLD
jgi:hypothetical protein